MRRILSIALALALLTVLVTVGTSIGQGQVQKTLLPTNGWGSLSGRVTYDGDPPTPANLLPRMQEHADKVCCLAGKDIEKVDHTWLVDSKTKGVANVLVYLKAPVGTYFPIEDKAKKRQDTVELDQPHCMFLPHVTALFPSYYDGEKLVPTGQKFEVKNSAVVPHNTRATGNVKYGNDGFNFTLPPTTSKVVSFNPQPIPVMINCDIHPWMKAWVGVYDHPYVAITKEDGTFEIPRVPAGAMVTVLGWHEDVGYAPSPKGIEIQLQAGKNNVDFQVKKR